MGDDRDRELAADGDGVVVRTAWTVAEPAIHAFRSSPLVEGFIAGDIEAASPDIYMRWAELKGVLESLHSNLGRTFVEESEAENSLFGCGGGFGIPNALKREVLETL